jgi:uncharacterized protein (DUF2141 family)
MKNKYMAFLIFNLFFALNKISADVFFNFEIHNVEINNGIIYIGIYFNETSYRNKTPEQVIEIEPLNNILSMGLNLPAGEYVIDAYQDINGNGKCDLGIFNIPKEPCGLTNYNGCGIPGNYNKLKIGITNKTQRIIIQLYKF